MRTSRAMTSRASVYVESCGCCIVIGKGDTELAFVDIGHEARSALQEVLARHVAAIELLARLEKHGFDGPDDPVSINEVRALLQLEGQ